MGRGNILPSLVSYSKSELKFMSIGMIHRLDRGQHRAASRVFSTLSLESSGARTRGYWFEYSWIKENLLEEQWEIAHTKFLLSARHSVKSLNILIISTLWGRYSVSCNCGSQPEGTPHTRPPSRTPRNRLFCGMPSQCMPTPALWLPSAVDTSWNHLSEV